MIDGISMAMLYEFLQRRFTFQLNGRKSKAALLKVMASISTSKACIMPVEISDGNSKTYAV